MLDPELQPFVESLPKLDFDPKFLAAYRDGIASQLAGVSADETLPVRVETHTAAASRHAPAVRILCYFPTEIAGPFPAILHIHGGGYILGTPEVNDAMNRNLAAALGCAIFSVDYRLAPETPHPGPVEDCYAALAWLHANAAPLQIDPARIGVKGESAGGGLAAALALLARDRGEIPLAFQHLIYPMLDDRTGTTGNPHPYTGAHVWTAEDNRFGWSSLLGAAPGSHGISPYAAAARAENLANLPPAFISVGALDLFLEEDLDYAKRLTRAGIAVELHIYPGACHGFDLAPDARISARANRDSLEALKESLGR